MIQLVEAGKMKRKLDAWLKESGAKMPVRVSEE